MPSSESPIATRSGDEFRRGLRDLGHIEGKTFVIEYRYADERPERLPALAIELARLPVDIIVTSGESAALAAKRATNTVPIVAIELGWDPVKAGLVASLARPEANLTGLATQSDELWQKRLALLKELAPNLNRLAVLWNPANAGNASCIAEIKAAAPTLGMQARYLEVGDASALDRAFADIEKQPVDAIVTCWDSVSVAKAKSIGDFALSLRVATVGPSREYVAAGGLMSFGTSLPAHRRRAAFYVDKILKGAKPAGLPLERPTQFDLVINLTTAKALGLALPPSFMLLADELIP